MVALGLEHGGALPGKNQVMGEKIFQKGRSYAREPTHIDLYGDRFFSSGADSTPAA